MLMAKDVAQFAKDLLQKADITIGGERPWDMQVHDPRLYARVLRQGNLGLGEAYMDGWWDAKALDQFIAKALGAHLDQSVQFTLADLFTMAKAYLFNLQTSSRASEVAEKHYDLDIALYTSFLDPYNQYSCGYFKGTEDLATAQEQKLDLICKKLGLKAGDRVLDIGCGWGGFAKYAAENYGAHVTGITLSKEQLAYAKEFTKGLSVDLRLVDYRDMHEQFDHIVSVGMLEHVGQKNYKEFMQVAKRCLKDDGLFLLHTIGYPESIVAGDAWMSKYIFPNGMTPSMAQLAKAAEKLFIIEDVHNFGAYYDKTLMAWFTNFDAAWPRLKAKYDERFYRMWKYYMLTCAGVFRSRNLELWQIVLSKHGVPGGYTSVR
jgi:cyclopropane-fatty-acyl-phospholipid synthase